MPFSLEVQQIEQTCSFKLSWGKQLRLTAKLPYPQVLTTRYQTWREAYLKFYKSGFRARVEQGGIGVLPDVDWRARLVQAEAVLLSEFHFWLSSAELLPIRSAIANAASLKEQSDVVDVLLTCDPMQLERLPWEAWELGTEFAASKPIRVARSPINIRAETAQRRRRGRLRILAILGDETGLDFKADRNAMQSLSSIAEVEFVGWQWGQEQSDLKAKICRAIADEQGWDILFFAGHSNETDLMGGELAIAPHESILTQEIAIHLTIAKERGLQFAIFNSCNGISIADALINLGLSQVAIMREPIHNRVAHEFLIRFVKRLAEYADVHDAIVSACQSLKLDKNLTYPSAYLIPSLFRHAEAELFKLEPFGWRQTLKQFLPTKRREVIALTTLTVLSLLPPVQDLLLETRMWSQAVYRQVTQQIPKSNQPPVLLVAIDDDSLQGVDARKISYLDRTYIAKLIDKAQTFQPKVIGIDYVFSSPIRDDDPVLKQSVQRAVMQNTWLVFGAQEDNGKEFKQLTQTIASPNQILNGYITTTSSFLELLPPGRSCRDACPFAYLLALAHLLKTSPTADLPQPRSSNSLNFRSQVMNYLESSAPLEPQVKQIQSTRLPMLTSISQVAAQEWLHPILDFSIPPAQAYQRVSARQFLDDSFQATLQLRELPPIVLIAPGGYSEAGINQPGEDNYAMPMAIAYWRNQPSKTATQSGFTGAEFHAYAVHHWLNRRWVIPIPDIWMLGVALVLAKGTVLILKLQRRNYVHPAWFILAITLYGLAGLQLYTAGIVVPWLLPSILFGIVLPVVKRKSNAA